MMPMSCDVIKLGGTQVIKQLKIIFNNILKSKTIPKEWKEAKIIILHKKGDRKDIKNYRPISLLSHIYKLFTRALQKRLESILDDSQPREQAGFRKGCSTTDHLQTINQIIEKCNEFNKPLCISFIDYEKAFDSVEHEAILKALQNIYVNENYISIIKDIYTDATARIHINEQVSEEIKILKGVRQGDPLSPKLFTATIQDAFRKIELEERGLNIDGENLSELRFADDIALITTTVRNMEEQLNMINDESKKIGLKIHRGKTKYMTNFNTNKKIIVENTEIEKVEEYRYLGQNIEMKDKTLKEVQKRIRAGWSAFGKYKFIFTNKEMPISLKRKTFNACIIPAMTYGCETWTLTKTIVHKLQVAQRAMERKILGIKITDKIPNEEISVKTNTLNIIKHITNTKWRWAGHVARMQDNRWTIRTTEWQVRKGRRPRGRPKMRWKDDIMKWQGAPWTRTAKDRKKWKELTEGYFQQWRDTA